MMKKIINDKRGSALLTAMLIMGILVSVSMMLSTLIFRESKTTLSILNSAKAYYAAESGVEISLHGLNTKLPGWQPAGEDEYKILEFGEEDSPVAVEYRVDNQCKAFPCFEDDFNVENLPLETLYYELGWNETLNVPLFVFDDESGEVQDVKGFSVQYYSPISKGDLALSGGDVDSFDVLRWKIFGLKEVGDVQFTEAISDFTAASLSIGIDGAENTDAKNPSWFGTQSCTGLEGRYNEEITCNDYVGENNLPAADFVFVDGQEAQVISGWCPRDTVKEYYDYQIDENNEQYLEQENIVACYPIKRFLENHTLNYLSMTNLVNKALFKKTENGRIGLTGPQIEAKSKLYVRVELYGENNQTVREFSQIESNGYFKDSKQSLGVQMRRGSVVPVFNFVLYSTRGGER